MSCLDTNRDADPLTGKAIRGLLRVLEAGCKVQGVMADAGFSFFEGSFV
jgi:hypothetical protein